MPGDIYGFSVRDPIASDGRLLIWDGTCGLCANFVETTRCHLKVTANAAPFQEVDLPAVGLSAEICLIAAQWIQPHASGANGLKIESGHRAIGYFLLSGNLASRLAGRIILLLGPLARLVYWMVSK